MVLWFAEQNRWWWWISRAAASVLWSFVTSSGVHGLCLPHLLSLVWIFSVEMEWAGTDWGVWGWAVSLVFQVPKHLCSTVMDRRVECLSTGFIGTEYRAKQGSVGKGCGWCCALRWSWSSLQRPRGGTVSPTETPFLLGSSQPPGTLCDPPLLPHPRRALARNGERSCCAVEFTVSDFSAHWCILADIIYCNMEDFSHLEKLILPKTQNFLRPANRTLIHMCEQSYCCKCSLSWPTWRSLPGVTTWHTGTTVLWVTDTFNILALLCVLWPSGALAVPLAQYVYGLNLV